MLSEIPKSWCGLSCSGDNGSRSVLLSGAYYMRRILHRMVNLRTCYATLCRDPGFETIHFQVSFPIIYNFSKCRCPRDSCKGGGALCIMIAWTQKWVSELRATTTLAESVKTRIGRSAGVVTASQTVRASAEKIEHCFESFHNWAKC